MYFQIEDIQPLAKNYSDPIRTWLTIIITTAVVHDAYVQNSMYCTVISSTSYPLLLLM